MMITIAVPFLIIFFLFAGVSFAADIVVSNKTELQDALVSANSGDRILLNESGVTHAIITLTNSIDGTASAFTLDGGTVDSQLGTIQGNGGFYSVNMGGNLVAAIQNIEINDGASSTEGRAGAFTADGITNAITNAAFRRNSSTSNGGGGAVYVGGDLTGSVRSNIHFDENTASGGSGGGLLVNGNFLGTIEGVNGDVHFYKNTAADNGGGLFVRDNFGGEAAPSRIFATHFTENTAQSGSGGGLYVGRDFIADLGDYVFFDKGTAGRNGGGMHVGRAFIGNMHLAWFRDNAAQTGSGGGLYVGQALTGSMRQIWLTANTAGGSGGGMHVGRALTGGMQNAWFERNRAGGNGGGLYADTLSGNIGGGVFFDANVAEGSGGAVYLAGDAAGEGKAAFSGTLNNVSFTSNQASGSGGAVSIGNNSDWTGSGTQPDGDVYNNIFTGNSAGTNGGAIEVTGNMRADSNRNAFTENHAGGNGGAVHLGGDLAGDMRNNTFTDNTAGGDGGAINAGSLTGNIAEGSQFVGNIAGGDGGAINTAGDMGGVIDGVTFQNNTATGGNGGAVSSRSFSGGVRASSFTGNTARGYGGALFGLPTIIETSIFSGNGASQGGAVYATGGGSQIRNSAFTDNGATDGGALYFAQGARIDLHNAHFDGNTASGQGGAIYFAAGGGTAYAVNLSADAGQSTRFTNNTHAGGNNSFYAGGTGAGAQFALSIGGDGAVGLYDPFVVNMGAGDFTMTHNAPDATLIMSGKNEVMTGGRASFAFTSGLTRIVRDSGDFTLRVSGGTDVDFTWGKNNILRIEGMEERANTLALVDLTGVTGRRSFTVEDGATLDITRVLKPLPNNRYLLVDGLDPADVHAGTITYLHPEGYLMTPMMEQDGTQLWLDKIEVPHAFDPEIVPPNVVEAEDCITQWLNHTEKGLALTPRQVIALRKDLRSGPPEAAADMALVAVDIHNTVVAAARAGFLDRGAASMRQGPFRFWSNYVGAVKYSRNHGGFSGYNTHTDGMLLGVAWEPVPTFSLGGYAGYSQSDTEFRSISADAESEATHAGLQASYTTPWGVRLTADGGFSHQSVDMERSPGHLGENAGEFDQNVASASLEVAYAIPVTEKTRVTPTASVSVSRVWQDAFTEKGDVLAARVDGVRGSSVTSSLGATVEHDFVFENGAITPGVGVDWKHQYTGRQRSVDYAFVDNACNGYPCKADSREQGADFLEVSGYVTGTIRTENAEWSLRAGYGMEVGERSLGHTFYGGFAVSF